MSETRHRYGDVREDGKVFVGYSKSCRNGEHWVSPERFALRRLNAKVRYYERKAELDDASPQDRKRRRAITLYTNPMLRIRPYAPRPSRRKYAPSTLSPMLYGPETPPATCIDDLVPIPNYDGYGITPDGAVHRLTTPTVGRNANIPFPRISPSLIPLSSEWGVQLKRPDGKYRRVSVGYLMELAFGSSQTNS